MEESLASFVLENLVNAQFTNKNNWNSSTLYAATAKLIEVLFIHGKNNFLRSNYEIRIKTKIFDQQNNKFLWTFTYQ
jgi:hypothetical protein